MSSPSHRLSPQDNIELRLAREYHSNLATYKKIISITKPLIECKLLEVRHSLDSWERIDVVARVKSFDSALNKLKKREGKYLLPTDSFHNLHDMAALKIRIFPNDHFKKVKRLVKCLFPKAIPDHKPPQKQAESDEEYYNRIVHLKYITALDPKYKIKTKFEIQIVPFILDAFMNIEHDVIYKPNINIPKIVPRLMEDTNERLVKQLKSWPAHFSKLMRKYRR